LEGRIHPKHQHDKNQKSIANNEKNVKIAEQVKQIYTLYC